MIYEDNILDYLDGALGDKESAELMHQLAVSPERRVILEQHLQLKNTISDARKPLAVPAAIEARLGERLPAIANYNRELAGVTLISTSARSPIFGRVAAGIAVLLLLGTATYVGLNSSNSGSDAASGPSVSNTSSTPSSSVSNAAGNPSINTPSVSSEIQPPSANSSTVNAPVSNVPTRTSGTHAAPHNVAFAQKDQIPVGVLPTKHESEQDKFIQQDISAGETPQIEGIDMIHDLRTDAASALAIGERTSSFAMRMPVQEPSEIPLALRLDYGAGAGANQVRENDASITLRSANEPTVGIDYLVTPYSAIAVEAGKTDVARVEEIATVVDDADLGIKRVTVSHDIRSHSEYDVRALYRHTFNPYDQVAVGINVGGGLAFGDKTSTLVTFGFTFSPRITETISLTVTPTWTGTFSTSGPAATVDPISGPVAYVAADQAAGSTLFTPSFLVKLGLRIKPW